LNIIIKLGLKVQDLNFFHNNFESISNVNFILLFNILIQQLLMLGIHMII
jgi:hypothetical protein